jgi:uncharacterized protein
MSDKKLTEREKQYLLRLARRAIECAVKGQPAPELEENEITPALRTNGASFVTLTEYGDLRGCIGALEPYQPLVEDVREHAAAAAIEDPRFPSVRANEVAKLHIEISCLSVPEGLNYESPDDLVRKLRPYVDGVVLRDGFRRATFLPQVWDQLPEPGQFLGNLCMKMGSPADLWKRKPVTVMIYQVEEFEETE